MIPNEKRKIEWWRFGEWVRSSVPGLRGLGWPEGAALLAGLKRLEQPFRQVASLGRDRPPGGAAIALGVPLLLALLVGVWGWPVSWRGETGERTVERPEEGEVRAVAPVAESGAEQERKKAQELETGMAKLREDLAEAREAQLVLTRSLSNLRSGHEAELTRVQEERDRLALMAAELRNEAAELRRQVAAEREAQAREAALRKREQEVAQERARQWEGELKRMEEEKGEAQRQVAALRERLRQAEEEQKARELEEAGGSSRSP